jgi:hypothetical protein
MWAAVSSLVAAALPRAAASRAPPRLRPVAASATLTRWRCTAAGGGGPDEPPPGEPAPPPKQRAEWGSKLTEEQRALLIEKQREHGRKGGAASLTSNKGFFKMARRACRLRWRLAACPPVLAPLY